MNVITDRDSAFQYRLGRLLREIEEDNAHFVGVRVFSSQPFERIDVNGAGPRIFDNSYNAYRSIFPWMRNAMILSCGEELNGLPNLSETMRRNLPPVRGTMDEIGEMVDLGLSPEERLELFENLDVLLGQIEWRENIRSLDAVNHTIVRRAIVRKGERVHLIQATLNVEKGPAPVVNGRRTYKWHRYEATLSISCRQCTVTEEEVEEESVETLLERLSIAELRQTQEEGLMHKTLTDHPLTPSRKAAKGAK
eukprot:CAMPEP_0171471052 /NCGR_PEP_ID=MMETSP0946-20130122/483_1 /TAXON_ID=109269 /ORGANISM="Vaucheria litorea, Strain CCMP2940" /LENGTH=250 /DNA_ID=CAMNT_0012000485 /DNA_START=191 /DNA_END=943 /DNA_ORIENTATION=+